MPWEYQEGRLQLINMNTKITTNVTIQGMHCEACQKIIQRRLGKIEGILEVQAPLSGEISILANRSISIDEVKTALEGTDYLVG